MLRRPTRNCLGPAGSTEELMYIRNPAFKMIGCTELTVGLINQQQPVSCSLEQVIVGVSFILQRARFDCLLTISRCLYESAVLLEVTPRSRRLKDFDIPQTRQSLVHVTSEPLVHWWISHHSYLAFDCLRGPSRFLWFPSSKELSTSVCRRSC